MTIDFVARDDAARALANARAANRRNNAVSSASGLLATMGSPGYDGKTFQAIRVAEAPYYGVRLIIRNAEATSFVVNSACVAASATASIPNPTGTWVPVTWNGGSTSVTIPAQLGANRPSETVSDVILLSSLARTDGGGYAQPYIYLRAYNATGPKSGLIGSTANPATGARANWATASALNRGRLFITSSATGDFASASQASMTDDSGNFSTFVYEFEAVFGVPALHVLGIGDSIMQGDGASIVAASYGFRSCADVSTTTRPVVWRNYGWSNMTTTNFRLRLSDTLTAGRKPHVCLIPTFSPNDTAPTQAIIDVCADNAMQMQELCRANGIIPVFVAPLPRAYTGSNETLRQQLVTFARNVFPTIPGVRYLLDADGILATSPGANTIAASFSGDSIHPNDAGNDALCNGLNGYRGLTSIISEISATYFAAAT